MFDSTWDSQAFREFCSEVVIVQNGDSPRFILACNGLPVSNKTYKTRKEAEDARTKLYDQK